MLTFEFYTIKFISRPIKVIDFKKNAWWKPEQYISLQKFMTTFISIEKA